MDAESMECLNIPFDAAEIYEPAKGLRILET